MNRFGSLAAALLLLAMLTAGLIQSQMTGPESFGFKSRGVENPRELKWGNVKGDLLDWASLNNPRLDTLPEMFVTVIVSDTIGDSSRTVFSITTGMQGYTNYSYSDTCHIWEQLMIPRSGGGTANGRIPDSTFVFVFNNQSPVISDAMRLVIDEVDPLSGFFQMIVFGNDTVKGTGVDTSETIYLGPGVKEATFGYKSSISTPEVTYEILYNLGAGWGFANPSDTLAAKTWTDDTPSNTWRYRDMGELLNATYMKIVRRGEAAADTAKTEQSIRLVPR